MRGFRRRPGRTVLWGHRKGDRSPQPEVRVVVRADPSQAIAAAAEMAAAFRRLEKASATTGVEIAETCRALARAFSPAPVPEEGEE